MTRAADHHQDCGWHVDQYPFECTCGVIGDADLLRAQLMGVPLPEPDQPKAHAQFKRREPSPTFWRKPAMPNWPPPGYHQLPDGERCRCIGMAQRGSEFWCCGRGRRAPAAGGVA